jgi:putative redox protein
MDSVSLTFPGGVMVDGTYKGHTVRTDQPLADGGSDSSVSPFDLFFVSMATCMGFYALRFCQQRDLPTDGLGLTLTPIRENEQSRRVTLVRVALALPSGFPEKYRTAIERSVDQCAVKKAVLEPPRFEIDLQPAT